MIKKIRIFSFLIAGFLAYQTSLAQQTDVPPAAFDVLIKTNGEIITAKVIEVNLRSIRYKRTDIPDGPIYEIRKEEVYAISYRNQIKEYISPLDSTQFFSGLESDSSEPVAQLQEESTRSNWYSAIHQGDIRVGIGVIRSFSKIKNVSTLTNESGSPGLFLTYVFPFRKNISLGLMAGYANFKYSEVSFSEFDQLQIERDIKESLFTVAAVGKYSLSFNFIHPYLLGGLSFTSSDISSDGTLTFIDDERVINVQNSARGSNAGIVFRFGFDVSLSKNISIYSDFGSGLSLVQVGGVFKLNEL